MPTPPPKLPGEHNRGDWADRQRKKKEREGDTSAPSVPATAAPYVPPGPYGTQKVETPKTPFDIAAQALLPYLSPEDAYGLSTYYGIPYGIPIPYTKDGVPSGAGIYQKSIPTEMTGSMRNYFLSRDRAAKAKEAVQKALVASGKDINMQGPGLAFLNNALTLLSQFGGAGGSEGMTRSKYGQFSKAIDDLFALAKGNDKIGDFTRLASMFLTPEFTAGSLMGLDKYGRPTKSGKLF